MIQGGLRNISVFIDADGQSKSTSAIKNARMFLKSHSYSAGFALSFLPQFLRRLQRSEVRKRFGLLQAIQTSKLD